MEKGTVGLHFLVSDVTYTSLTLRALVIEI